MAKKTQNSKPNQTAKKPVGTQAKKMKTNKKEPGKFRLFCEKFKKEILIASCAFLSVVLIAAIIITAVSSYYGSIPYGIRFKDYISVPQYIGMKFKNSDIEEQFENQKTELLLKHATFETITEGKIEKMYSVTIDAKGYLLKDDGKREEKVFENGTLTGYTITNLGDHYTSDGTAFSSEIQEALIGKDASQKDAIVVSITYPETYKIESLRNKKAEFDITIKKVEKPTLPAFTDTFVLATTGYGDIKEYEVMMREEIRNSIVWNTLMSGVQIKKFPMDIIDEYSTEFAEPYNQYMSENSMEFEDMLKELEITKEEYFDSMDSYAYGLVREEMVLYFITRTEGITFTDEEYKTIGLELATANGYNSLSAFEDGISKEDVERAVLWEKLKMFLVDASIFE